MSYNLIDEGEPKVKARIRGKHKRRVRVLKMVRVEVLPILKHLL